MSEKRGKASFVTMDLQDATCKNVEEYDIVQKDLSPGAEPVYKTLDDSLIECGENFGVVEKMTQQAVEKLRTAVKYGTYGTAAGLGLGGAAGYALGKRKPSAKNNDTDRAKTVAQMYERDRKAGKAGLYKVYSKEEIDAAANKGTSSQIIAKELDDSIIVIKGRGSNEMVNRIIGRAMSRGTLIGSGVGAGLGGAAGAATGDKDSDKLSRTAVGALIGGSAGGTIGAIGGALRGAIKVAKRDIARDARRSEKAREKARDEVDKIFRENRGTGHVKYNTGERVHFKEGERIKSFSQIVQKAAGPAVKDVALSLSARAKNKLGTIPLIERKRALAAAKMEDLGLSGSEKWKNRRMLDLRIGAYRSGKPLSRETPWPAPSSLKKKD